MKDCKDVQDESECGLCGPCATQVLSESNLATSPHSSSSSQTITMLPPKYTRSVTVTAEDTDITITVRYGASKEEDEIVVVKEIGEGESHTFEEKSEDMGSWQNVRKILSIKGQIGEDGEVFEKLCETDCEGVHSNIHYTVHKWGVYSRSR
eukprot:GFUD01116586.1.p1 GENE.GFUD01116586.1~~GFUD01116586.1.p1  ORF type:complete len:151 (+),score=49.63 GFUD01116586.1:25-477(+)